MTALADYAKKYDVQGDTTATGANVSANQSSFPALVVINSSNMSAGARSRFFDAVNNPDGKLHNFYLDGDQTNPLKYEVEDYDVGANVGIYWVKLGTATGNNKTALNKLWLGYGDGANGWPGTDQDDIANTWVGFISVFHLNENHPGGAFYDSAGTQDLTNVGTTSGTGLVGKGRSYDGVPNDGMTATHNAAHWIGKDGAVSCVLKHPASAKAYIIDKFNNSASGDDAGTARGYLLWMDIDGKLRWTIGDGAGSSSTLSTGSIDDDAFHHLAGSYEGVTDQMVRAYIDGVADGTVASTKTPTPTTEKLAIGYEGEAVIDNLKSAILDEVRLHAQSRPADWWLLEHFSMANTGTFPGDGWLTWGSEQDVGDGGISIPVVMHHRRQMGAA